MNLHRIASSCANSGNLFPKFARTTKKTPLEFRTLDPRREFRRLTVVNRDVTFQSFTAGYVGTSATMNASPRNSQSRGENRVGPLHDHGASWRFVCQYRRIVPTLVSVYWISETDSPQVWGDSGGNNAFACPDNETARTGRNGQTLFLIRSVEFNAII